MLALALWTLGEVDAGDEEIRDQVAAGAGVSGPDRGGPRGTQVDAGGKEMSDQVACEV